MGDKDKGTKQQWIEQQMFIDIFKTQNSQEYMLAKQYDPDFNRSSSLLGDIFKPFGLK